MEAFYAPQVRAKLDIGDVIKVASPLVGGMLAALGGIMMISAKTKDEKRRAQLMFVAWGILTAFGAMAQVVQEISEKQAAQLGLQAAA